MSNIKMKFIIPHNDKEGGILTFNYYFANDNNDTISLGKLNEKSREGFFDGCDDEYIKNYEEKVKEHSDYIVYKVCAYKDGYFVNDVYVGNKKEISKQELYDLFNEKYKDEDIKLDKRTFNKYTFQFQEMYLTAVYEDESQKRLIEIAKNAKNNKLKIQYLINKLNDKNVSNIKYLEILKNIYRIDNKSVLDVVLNKYYKNPTKLRINTNIKGSPHLEMLGYGRDFSYIMHDTKKSFDIYVENGVNIDTSKKYSKEEFISLVKQSKAIVVEPYNDEILNISETKLAKIIRSNITKEQLLDDYAKYMYYYNLVKLEVTYGLKKHKKTIQTKINKLKGKIKEGNKMVNTLKDDKEFDF